MVKKAIYYIGLVVTITIITHPVDSHARSSSRAPVDRGASYAGLVIDAETGRVLYDKNSDKIRHPASLTKMMTLYLTFDAIEKNKLNLNDTLVVSRNASLQSPSKLGLRAGQSLRVEDAILGLVTESANDAAVVLGEHLGGTIPDFAVLMTKQARALGMSKTTYRNASGLPDPEQVTTARDQAMLGYALIHHFPRFYSYFSRSGFHYRGNYYNNHNHLMERYDGMDGIKTGYIRASGFNLVASAKRGSTRLIGVVFGGRSAVLRDNHMANLLDDAFARMDREQKKPTRIASAITAPKPLAQGDAEDEPTLPPMAMTAPSSPPEATPAPATPPDEHLSWSIQIGAFSSPASSEAALANTARQAQSLLAKAERRVVKVSNASSTVYRARFTGLSEENANRACADLIKQGNHCTVITP